LKQPLAGALKSTTLLYKPITQSKLQQTTLTLTLTLKQKKLLQNFLFEKALAVITMRFKKNPSLPSLGKQKF
jgi:hypothetical protein